MPVTLEDHFPEIERDLRAGLNDLVEDTAGRIRDNAKLNAPFDDGDLKEVIHVERVGPFEWAVVAGGRSTSGVDVWYAHLLEWGHNVVVGRGPGRQERRIVGHIAPRPFLTPALEAQRPIIEMRAAQLRERLG